MTRRYQIKQVCISGQGVRDPPAPAKASRSSPLESDRAMMVLPATVYRPCRLDGSVNTFTSACTAVLYVHLRVGDSYQAQSAMIVRLETLHKSCIWNGSDNTINTSPGPMNKEWGPNKRTMGISSSPGLLVWLRRRGLCRGSSPQGPPPSPAPPPQRSPLSPC